MLSMLTSAGCPTGADEASSVAVVREMLNSSTEVFTWTPFHENSDSDLDFIHLTLFMQAEMIVSTINSRFNYFSLYVFDYFKKFDVLPSPLTPPPIFFHHFS